MAIRKNKKRIDPRYFLNETTTRDLKEQEQMVIDVDDNFRAAFGQLRQRFGDNIVLKVPGEELYFRMRRLSKRTRSGDNQYGVRIDYSTAPDMSQPGVAAIAEPGDNSDEAMKAITDPNNFLAQTLSKKTDKVEVIPPKQA